MTCQRINQREQPIITKFLPQQIELPTAFEHRQDANIKLRFGDQPGID